MFLVWICLACDTNFFPEGLYDYQVERLLSAGDSLVWDQTLSSENCQDSVKLLFALLSSTADDSVAVLRLVANDQCTGFDTTIIGNADASSFSDALLFTDSLNFDDGSYWIIQSVTSELLVIESDQIHSYTSRLEL